MPYTQSWQDHEEKYGRVVLHGSVEEIRGTYDKLIEVLLPHLPKPSENVEVQESEVDGVKYRVYKTKGLEGPLPVAIWTHGGGFITGDLNSDHILACIVAEATSSVVVNVDYRLAPESKWPGQLEDTLKVYKWAHKNAASIGGDANKFYTAGGSAGGGLALGVANRILQDPELKGSIKGVVALVPLTVHWDNVPEEYRANYTAYKDNEKDVPIIDKESMDIFYRETGCDPKDPSAFVLLAKDNHKNFPPTYLASCEYDPLRDDAYAMEKALKDAGVPVKHDHYKGLPHYFWIFPWVQEAQQFFGNLIGGIEWVKSQM